MSLLSQPLDQGSFTRCKYYQQVPIFPKVSRKVATGGIQTHNLSIMSLQNRAHDNTLANPNDKLSQKQ